MDLYEQSAEALEVIVRDYGNDPDPTYTEADTRAKIIDRFIREVLGWPEKADAIRREEHVHEGYIDYRLRTGPHGLIIEAKKVGAFFVLPVTVKYGGRLSVKNLLQKQRDLLEMYDQVAKYAHESGVQFCVLTNGTQWLVFPGVRVDQIHIRKSRVIVFNGFEDIRSNFVEFWNLLSYSAVSNGSLPRQLLEPISRIEPTFIFNSEGRQHVPYDRNPLSAVLVDILPKYFGDLHGDPASTDMLRECFVSDSPVRQGLEHFDVEGQDERPSSSITAVSPVMHFYELPQVGDRLNAMLRAFLDGERDRNFQVLVGRVGIGKTTFLNHFFNVHNRALIEDHFVLQLDFRNISESTNIDWFFNSAMWELLTEHPKFRDLTSEDALKRIFAQDIELLERGPLSTIRHTDVDRYNAEIASYLASQFREKDIFLSRLSKYLYKKRIARFIIVFDNVDQLDIPLQEKIIQYAHTKMTEYNSFLVMSMWEETYYSSKRTSRILSTIRTVPLQIARQSTAAVIIKRLDYLIKQINEGKEKLTLLDETVCNSETFCSFLQLILRSLLERNRRVRMFLELVSLGNIRSGLEMFHAFLTAGSFETTKIIALMKENEEYLVPVHEFIKSVMLGSKRYYSERTSTILNLFAIGDIEHPSHFTRLRILQWLYERRHEATPYGSGFMTLPRVTEYFKNIGITTNDTTLSLRRLSENALIENDIRAIKSMEQATAVRITPTGRYYLTSLSLLFAYIDLALQDTPFLDEGVFHGVASRCESTDMGIRFERCEIFLDYLADQEQEELITLKKLGQEVTWRNEFIPRIRVAYEREKEFILKKEQMRREEPRST